MNIRKKAEQAELSVEKVAEIGSAAGIDIADLDRQLDNSETMLLASAVKKFKDPEQTQKTDEPKTVLFWSQNTKHTIARGILQKPELGPVVFVDHKLRLDAKDDAALIAKMRRLRVPEIFEIKDSPFDEDSDEYYDFKKILEELVFTGRSGERSKAGTKAIRAMFADDELLSMGDKAFDAGRLIAKALRSKSAIRVINS